MCVLSDLSFASLNIDSYKQSETLGLVGIHVYLMSLSLILSLSLALSPPPPPSPSCVPLKFSFCPLAAKITKHAMVKISSHVNISGENLVRS